MQRSINPDLCPVAPLDAKLLPEDWELVRFYERVRSRIYQIRIFNEQDTEREYWSEVLDLAQLVAALQLYRIPEDEWRHYSDSAELLFAIERDLLSFDDFPLDED